MYRLERSFAGLYEQETCSTGGLLMTSLSGGSFSADPPVGGGRGYY